EIATVGKFSVHGADDGERNTFDANHFAEGRFATEKFFAQLRTEKNHTAAFGNVLRGKPAAIAGDFVAHFTVLGIDAANGGIFEAFFVRDGLEFHGFASDATDERRLRFDPLGVFGFEADGFAGPFATGLFASGARPSD